MATVNSSYKPKFVPRSKLATPIPTEQSSEPGNMSWSQVVQGKDHNKPIAEDDPAPSDLSWATVARYHQVSQTLSVFVACATIMFGI